MTRCIFAVSLYILLSVAIPAWAQQIDPIADALTEKLQAKFSDAYNRKDVTTMAGFFGENGWRITPSGVFQGRDAIRREMERVIQERGLTARERNLRQDRAIDECGIRAGNGA